MTVKCKIAARGFTLIEMAIVLVIVGFLLGGILGSLSARIDIKKYNETSTLLSDISEALTGFAIVNRRLPCADNDGDGIEDAGACNIEGNIPWVTLGLGQYDAWGRSIRYRSDAAFNAASLIPDPPDATSSLSVVDINGTALTPVGADGPVAIIFSCGKNGIPDDENDADLTANTDAVCSNNGAGGANGVYVQNSYIENQFDDALIWMSKNSLINSLVSAGKWP